MNLPLENWIRDYAKHIVVVVLFLVGLFIQTGKIFTLQPPKWSMYILLGLAAYITWITHDTMMAWKKEPEIVVEEKQEQEKPFPFNPYGGKK